jgi:hypothetical protein
MMVFWYNEQDLQTDKVTKSDHFPDVTIIVEVDRLSLP